MVESKNKTSESSSQNSVYDNQGYGYATESDAIAAVKKAGLKATNYRKDSRGRWVCDPESKDSEGSEESEAKTYKEELQAIANKKNFMWHVNCNNELVTKSFIPPTYEKADFKLPEWNMEKDSFTYDVNEKEFISGVKIKYKNGTLIVKSEQLFAIRGEAGYKIESYPDLTKTKATEKAWEILYTALRDADITISFKCLLDYRIQPIKWIGLTNPKSKAKEVFVVKNVDVDLNPKKKFLMTVTCGFLVKSDKTKDSKSIGSLKDMDSIGKQAATFTYCSACQSGACIEKSNCGSCWAMSGWLYDKLSAAGFKVKIVEYVTSMSNNHQSVLYWDNGWKDFPYRKYNIGMKFRNTAKSKSARTIKTNKK